MTPRVRSPVQQVVTHARLLGVVISTGLVFGILSGTASAQPAPKAEVAVTVAPTSAEPASGVLGGVLASAPRPCSEWGTSADLCRQLRAASARMKANNKPLTVVKEKKCTELKIRGKGKPKEVPCPEHKFTDGGIWDPHSPGKTNSLQVVGSNDNGSPCFTRIGCDHPAPYDEVDWGTSSQSGGGSGGLELGGAGNNSPPPSNNGGPKCYFDWAAGC